MNKIKMILIIIIFLCASIYIFKTQAKSIKNVANKTVNIVFTTDSKYKDYLKVTIQSALDNKNLDSVYNIHILCVDLPDIQIKEFKRFERRNVHIYPVSMDSATIENVGQFKVSNHVSRADLFKFFMPDIFPKYDKILYIDSDTLILGDLLPLFNTEISGKYLGAVLKYDPVVKTKYYVFTEIKTKSYTYNCGVLLYNLEKFRKENITRKLIEAKNSDKKRILMTQDAFNTVIPPKNIKKLSPVYNAYSRWRTYYFKKYNFRRVYFPYCINMKNMDDLYKKVVIVHFAGPKKPWMYTDIKFSKEWWFYENRTKTNIKPPARIQKSKQY